MTGINVIQKRLVPVLRYPPLRENSRCALLVAFATANMPHFTSFRLFFRFYTLLFIPCGRSNPEGT